jgi:hypothetical protein
VAFSAAVLYGLGTALAGKVNTLAALYLTSGVVPGPSLGLGHIVPIATLVRWFPDKRGMITGIAMAGLLEVQCSSTHSSGKGWLRCSRAPKRGRSMNVSAFGFGTEREMLRKQGKRSRP